MPLDCRRWLGCAWVVNVEDSAVFGMAHLMVGVQLMPTRVACMRLFGLWHVDYFSAMPYDAAK
jgi:hypothetical protein